MHSYDEASETAYFKRHKIKMKIPTKIPYFRIPAPTGDDLKWAKEIFHTKREVLKQDLPKPHGLWRIGFLMTIPDHGKINNYGLDRDQKTTLLRHYIGEGNIEATSLCLQYCEAHLHDLLHAVEKAPPEFVKAFVEKHNDKYKNTCKNPAVLDAAIYRGDIEIMKFIHDKGADIVTNHQEKVELALSIQQPEVAKFLTDTYDQIQEKAGIKDKAMPALKANNGDKWERMGENQIAKHSTFDEGKQSLTEIFNFDSQQVITVQNNARLNTSSSFAQNFKDIQNQDYIKAAATELVKLGGSSDECTTTPVKLSLPLKA